MAVQSVERTGTRLKQFNAFVDLHPKTVLLIRFNSQPFDTTCNSPFIFRALNYLQGCIPDY
jgi:hypothetical protein